jgi:DNA-binding response OmpR family regulator
MHRILVVDDEEALVKGIEMNLKREGYDVLTAYEGEEAVRAAVKHNPHLIVLDVMMPGMSGIEVCQAIRKKELDTRIIMVSAKSDEIDRVVGLEVGADDYIAKPFSMRELQALIRARLRYRSAACESVTTLNFGDVTMDFEKCRATKAGKPLGLTPREFEILQCLMQHKGQVVTREQLRTKVWGNDIYTTVRTVDNHILKLRKKVESNPANPQYILSVYGGGYKFVA